jgi:hypothetical protein
VLLLEPRPHPLPDLFGGHLVVLQCILKIAL